MTDSDELEQFKLRYKQHYLGENNSELCNKMQINDPDSLLKEFEDTDLNNIRLKSSYSNDLEDFTVESSLKKDRIYRHSSPFELQFTMSNIQV